MASFDGKRIGEISPTTHVVSEFPLPTAESGPAYITTGPDGNLWFTEFYGNRIGQVVLTPPLRTVYWTGAAGDGKWNTPGNWSINDLPGPNDAVEINDPGITVTHSTGSD